MKAKTNNPIIAAGANIGALAAEADSEFLNECFVDHPALSLVRDRNSRRMILLGSTGIGKTAILRMILKDEDKSTSLELNDMSMSYIANSNVIQFLLAMGLSLDHFFQALWKHIICVEYIKLRYNVDSIQRSKNFWQRLKDRFSRQDVKSRALNYLEMWEGKFWIDFDESAREITKNFEQTISANFSAELERFKTDAGFIRKLGEERKHHLQQRLKNFVDVDLLADLSQVINLLSEYEISDVQTHYVLIDKLDENWIAEDIKVHLIRALIEVLKSMRRIEDLKVIAALRSDLMEKVIHDTKSLGFQSEKYEDYIVRISWSADDLKSFANKRINFLYRRRYTRDNVFFEDIFPSKIGKENSFPYLVDKTLNRPRDLLTFINECLQQAKGSTTVSETNVRQAERDYSQNRRIALVEEWRSVFPASGVILECLRGGNSYFDLREWWTSKFVDQLWERCFDDELAQTDAIAQELNRAIDKGGDARITTIVSSVAERLYLMGAIGLNTEANLPVQWFYKSQRRVDQSALRPDTRVRVHPMLFNSLAIVK